MLKTIKAIQKPVKSNCDYWSITRSEQQQALDETKANVIALSKNKDFDLYAVEPLYIKGAVPRRGLQSTTGRSGTYQSMLDYICDLHSSKYKEGDMSGRQITGLNNINEILGTSEICQKVNLPYEPTVIVDKADNSQLIYTTQGRDRRINQKIFHRIESGGSTFHELFSGLHNE